MSILKPMSNSKIKVPTCTHKAFVESPTVVGMKVKDAIATVIHKALCEEGGIHSIFPYFMQVSLFCKCNLQEMDCLLIRVFKCSPTVLNS